MDFKAELATAGYRLDPSVKVLQYGDKIIMLAPGAIALASGGTVIALSDEEGLNITTDKDIRLQSEKDITFTVGEELAVLGTKRVEIKSESANVEMGRVLKIDGKEIKTN